MKNDIKYALIKFLIGFCLFSYVMTFVTSDIDHLPTFSETGAFMLHSTRRTCQLVLCIIGEDEENTTESDSCISDTTDSQWMTEPDSTESSET